LRDVCVRGGCCWSRKVSGFNGKEADGDKR
jgi:hypothetical protein